MKISPVQLKAYYLSRLLVEPSESISFQTALQPSEPFDWTGVTIQSNVEFAWGDGQGDDPRAYVMRLGLRTAPEGKQTPYKLDIEALGYFELIGEIKVSDREDIAKVNGASLLYGALREVLFSATARFPKGALILPTVNFYDLKSPSAQAMEGLSSTSMPAATFSQSQSTAITTRP